ncbi:transporter substrate-binding domain-containing protein [Shinella yambaruensis]|uniref:ABC transporter substrate-binding protein n=1 Tax=Shinella yambaruensis TaxID=415996 RepID=A0ABQ5ZP29_9HYPH|nr:MULTISPECIES: transporter substrate-binding domain-containing protein [Shinella]CAI0334436.1 Lysine-arginine-ornithine-binding periplasmic protein ArgT [Rhizobiaceae bacterium]CAK7260617.1 polar amino acid transport system substrate-binding protein [Shinella sp. WSC3-e]MCJ8027182.1 transporter substrate-binding domain-containing protein [Shinella yambaruensis]MCU7981238.1 transporter substrate-binding domain-containing protein [Shinella yambaruensis]MCW5709204.1 transporter substrate-bindin
MKATLKTLFATAIMAAALTAAQAAEQIDIATDATFPPFEYIDSEGKLVGYDIELMEAICEAAALDCNIFNAAWDGMIPGLIDGKYDALISQLTVTEKRRQVIAFSDIYDRPIFRFVAKKGAAFDFTPEGLAGKTIAVQTGTPMDAYVTSHFPTASIKRYDTGSAPYLELTAGRADLHISYQAQIIHGFLKNDAGKDFELVGPQLTGADAEEFGEGVAIAINKKNAELVEKVNKGLAAIRENGKLDAINAKYFGE